MAEERGLSGLKPPEQLRSLTAEEFKKWKQKKELMNRQQKQENYYNKFTRPLPKLEKGQIVKIKEENSSGPHKSGIIVREGNVPRSYIVKTEEGGYIQRNRKHLIKNGKYYNDFRRYDDCRMEGRKENVDCQLEQNNINQSESTSVNNNNNNLNDCDINLEMGSKSPIYTRSGREVRRPHYLNDYCN
ncbi:hypothetical protein ACJJTC_008832 [Scirpophaga incertulas]